MNAPQTRETEHADPRDTSKRLPPASDSAPLKDLFAECPSKCPVCGESLGYYEFARCYECGWDENME